MMSPWLFTLFMNEVVREVNQLLFANDTVLAADLSEKLHKLMSDCGSVCVKGVM